MCVWKQCSHPPIHLLWPRGVLSREHLPDWYLFLGPKEKGSLLSPSYSYRCQMEGWPRESLNGGRPEFNQTMEIREQRESREWHAQQQSSVVLDDYTLQKLSWVSSLSLSNMVVENRNSCGLTGGAGGAWINVAQCHPTVCFVMQARPQL